MAKAKKLKSGNWNIRIYIGRDGDGMPIQKSITAPTKHEAEYLAAQYRHKPKEPIKATVRRCIEEYIKNAEVLSPTTLSAYRKILQYAFPHLMEMEVSGLTDEKVQREINREAKRPAERTKRPLSAKTVKNEWGLVAAALNSNGYTFNVRLPRYQPHIKDYPEPATILEAIQGSKIELPCLLAMWLSFSLSEIRGINCSDISKGYLTINRVRVDVDGETREKNTAKVDTRLRRHRIPPYIMRLINESESYKNWLQSGSDAPLVGMTRNQIYHYWKKLGEKNGFSLSFHDLRHMNASIMVMLNVPEKYAMERGGWKTPHVMKSVYQHTFSSERERVDSQIDSFFETALSE